MWYRQAASAAAGSSHRSQGAGISGGPLRGWVTPAGHPGFGILRSAGLCVGGPREHTFLSVPAGRERTHRCGHLVLHALHQRLGQVGQTSGCRMVGGQPLAEYGKGWSQSSSGRLWAVDTLWWRPLQGTWEAEGSTLLLAQASLASPCPASVAAECHLMDTA